MKGKPKIGPEERDKIAILLTEGKSLRKIAKILYRSVSSVSEEVKRNSSNGFYSSISAQTLSESRNRSSKGI
jgi:IS30 family transposase